MGGACSLASHGIGDVIVDRFETTLTEAGTFALRIGWFRGDGDRPWQDLALTSAPPATAAPPADDQSVELAAIAVGAR